MKLSPPRGAAGFECHKIPILENRVPVLRSGKFIGRGTAFDLPFPALSPFIRRTKSCARDLKPTDVPCGAPGLLDRAGDPVIFPTSCRSRHGSAELPARRAAVSGPTDGRQLFTVPGATTTCQSEADTGGNPAPVGLGRLFGARRVLRVASRRRGLWAHTAKQFAHSAIMKEHFRR